MGCDIHLVLERRVAKGLHGERNDRWVAVNTFESHHPAYGSEPWSTPAARSRNYTRFAALAGVRGEGPIPRGLPENISETTKYLIDMWGGDGHSHSYLPVTEAAAIFLRTSSGLKDDSVFGYRYPASHFFGVEDEDEENFRIVFWFDN